MQKFQFYLAPNRITVTTDLVGFNTEYRQVYQRKIKLYKGIDNTIELDVRNAEQRKEDVVGKEVIMKFYDADHKNLFTAQGTPIISKPGLMSVTIAKEDLDFIDPQKLTAAAYLHDDATTEVLYADGQFELFAQVELFDGFNDKFAEGDVIDELKVFNYEFDRGASVSEIGLFGSRTNNDYSTAPTRTITAELVGTYEGTIEAQATNDQSTALGNRWTTIYPDGNTTDWDAGTDTSVNYSGDYRFIRFIYPGKRPGSSARFTVTAVGSTYTSVLVINRGQDYTPGDQLTILGSYLGGDDGVNDLTITVNDTNINPPGSINSTTISWSGTAAGNGSYLSVAAEQTSVLKTIDKIIIRN